MRPREQRAAARASKAAIKAEYAAARREWIDLTRKTTLAETDPADLPSSIPYPPTVRDAAVRLIAARTAWASVRRLCWPAGTPDAIRADLPRTEGLRR